MEHQLVMMPIGKVKPYKRNPRINDNAVEYVANSIREFGFQNPIILDKNNTIICGHTRHKAAKKLGLTEVPCIIAAELTPSQVKAFRLADNRLSELSEWNADFMKLELEELSKLDIALAPLAMGDTFTRCFLQADTDSVNVLNGSGNNSAGGGGAEDYAGASEDEEDEEAGEYDSGEAYGASATLGRLCMCPRCGFKFEVKAGGEE